MRSLRLRYVLPLLALGLVLVFPIRAFNNSASESVGDFAADGLDDTADVRHDADYGASRQTAGSTSGALSTAALVPANLLQLPPRVGSAIVVDLLGNSLYLIQNGERLSKSGSYYVAIGKKGIDKMREGDEKTPVGVYFPNSFLPDRVLPAIYGAGAFPIDYPNRWDRRLGRTGSGIWIHGSDKSDEDLLARSSRGCLTLTDPDFVSMASHMQVRRTPVIVANSVKWVNPEQIAALSADLRHVIETWRSDWESRDTEAYLKHYSTSFRSPDKTAAQWFAHKRRVNSAKSFIEVAVTELGLYRYPGEDDLVLATFAQGYKSNNFDSQINKQQYWRREKGEWRIVYEGG